MLAIAGRVVFRRPMTSDIVVIIHRLGMLLSMLVGLDLVDLVHSLGLSQLVDLGADKTSNGLLGELVANRLA